ncbi:25S rRNA (uracil2634-N3)-methyltransferase [Aspergillus homomorphus CBS 101889]|uniref:25S rRNA (uridine-N(3))-methyltransferase BMT5-like domain-containing protein n=1 Tax=Aspergillus homomorphus (strain CBS 101889) TaxID=1450537 RepID=A0A395HQ48_ASPHC|nr:hypothetical protein BO97DRAFT_408358 [Aspergillus homomorphus CBS 101889]RAL08374.1 hypothetical protein BO97DRAFT_408358 [Aspergillus homomorphus CBS 101889]
MGKSKKARPRGDSGAAATHQPKKHRKMQTFSRLSTTTTPGRTASKHDDKGRKIATGASALQKPAQRQNQHRRPIVPFGKKDRILLVGEGDFSFARSLVRQYRCKNVLATCYDSKETLRSKYPQADHIINSILGVSDNLTSPKGEQNQLPGQRPQLPKILYSVDARKLGFAAGGGKDVRTGWPKRERRRPAWQQAKTPTLASTPKGGPWDIISFNFPHVGGLSTDVNRQVRANQELLVAFFKACIPLLSLSQKSIDDSENFDWDDWEDSDSELSQGDANDVTDDDKPIRSITATGQAEDQHRVGPGRILVTIFEGEPYTLWNIKDLARHAGLQVVTSFKFPWACYQDYSHARTLGEVEGKNGGRGGWRGEDRDARTYVFELRQDDQSMPGKDALPPKADQSAKKKRSREASDSDSD